MFLRDNYMGPSCVLFFFSLLWGPSNLSFLEAPLLIKKKEEHKGPYYLSFHPRHLPFSLQLIAFIISSEMQLIVFKKKKKSPRIMKGKKKKKEK